jgi:hypothetical protein
LDRRFTPMQVLRLHFRFTGSTKNKNTAR